MSLLTIIILGSLLLPFLQRRERRPIVVVQQGESDYERSGFSTSFLLPFLFGGMLFLASKTDVFENLQMFNSITSSETNKSPYRTEAAFITNVKHTPDPIRAQYLAEHSDNTTLNNNQNINADIQSTPSQFPALAPLLQPPQTQEIQEPPMEQPPRPKQKPFWGVILKKYAYSDIGRLYALQDHFLNRNIEDITMSNGEHWAVIRVESEREGILEAQDWQRHRKDFQHMNLLLEVKDLNNN